MDRETLRRRFESKKVDELRRIASTKPLKPQARELLYDVLRARDPEWEPPTDRPAGSKNESSSSESAAESSPLQGSGASRRRIVPLIRKGDVSC